MAQKRARYSWEAPSWEADAEYIPGVDHQAGSDDEMPPFNWLAISQAEAGSELYEMLVGMKAYGTKMTAKHCCTLAFLAAKAGAIGPLQRLAFNPGSQKSGHCSRHVDSVNGFKERSDRYYWPNIVLHHKLYGTNMLEAYPMIPLHEAINDEIMCTPDIFERLDALTPNLPPSFRDHVTVRKNQGETCSR